MKCANCYKDISSSASICPYCNKDTTASKAAESIQAPFLNYGMLIGLIACVALVWDTTKHYESLLFWFLPRSPIYGRISAGILGAMLGGAAGWVASLPWYLPALAAAKASNQEVPPRTPSQAKPEPVAPTEDLVSTSGRLKALAKLKVQELISDEEYYKKRDEIISGL